MIQILELSDLENLRRKLITIPSGSKVLDSMLEGGFRNFSITEIYGNAGTGKTRLLHQITLQAAIALENGIYFIDNEGSFRPELMMTLAKYTDKPITSFFKKIKIARSLETEQFLESLVQLKNVEVKFLAIDTLTTHLRFLDRRQFSNIIREILFILRLIANKGACVVFTNQVTVKDEGIFPVGGRLAEKAIDYRIRLEKEDARVKLSLELPVKRTELFRITERGIIGFREKIYE